MLKRRCSVLLTKTFTFQSNKFNSTYQHNLSFVSPVVSSAEDTLSHLSSLSPCLCAWQCITWFVALHSRNAEVYWWHAWPQHVWGPRTQYHPCKLTVYFKTHYDIQLYTLTHGCSLDLDISVSRCVFGMSPSRSRLGLKIISLGHEPQRLVYTPALTAVPRWTEPSTYQVRWNMPR